MKKEKTGAQRWHRRRFYKFLDAESGRVGTFDDNGSVTWLECVDDEPLMIYGYETDSPYVEDHEGIDKAEANGWTFGEWFSEVCPEGELGGQRASRLIEITEAEFEEACAGGNHKPNGNCDFSQEKKSC